MVLGMYVVCMVCTCVSMCVCIISFKKIIFFSLVIIMLDLRLVRCTKFNIQVVPGLRAGINCSSGNLYFSVVPSEY